MHNAEFLREGAGVAADRPASGHGDHHVAEQSVTIRNASVDDARAILEIYTPYVTDTAISFEEEPPSVEEMASRIEHSHVWLVAEDRAALAGYAYASPFHRRAAYRWSVEVSVYLRQDSRGRGIGTRLVGELLDALRARGFVNAFAGTTIPNPASVALFESFGFEKIGHQRHVGFKRGTWHDVGWWQLQLGNLTASPVDPA